MTAQPHPHPVRQPTEAEYTRLAQALTAALAAAYRAGYRPTTKGR